MAKQESGSSAIAVIGIACRFPGNATDPERLWKMIVDGEDAWSEIPKSRINTEGWYHPDPNRPGSVSSFYF
jgi:acyl transferase domain-containing protein